ncbi:MAG: D-aminoacylase [bacterium]
MFDLIIRGTTIYDGTGAPARTGDVAVNGDRIAAVGELACAGARETISAAGKALCPGFIDVHSHSDAYLLIEPSAPSKISQGVTTEIVGNCGASAAPRTPLTRLPSDWADKPYPAAWESVADYRALLEQVRPAVNVVMLAGHNRLRSDIMGYAARPATAAEVAEMCRLLEQAFDEGVHGLSSGLLYTPGCFSESGEVEALARVTARRGGIYTTHMRSEGARLLESLDETLALGRSTGVRLEVSHLKTSGRAHWGKLDAALERLRAARAEGLVVAADRYPYTAASTDLDVLLPEWASGDGRDAVLARLADPVQRARIREDILSGRAGDYWGMVQIASTHHPDNLRFQGRMLTEVAASLGLEPVDAALHLMATDTLHTSAFFFGMSEANLTRILAEPYVMIGSDASLRAPDGVLSRDHPHPRAYGTFPRFLRAAFDGRTVPVAGAIRKMTALPASHFGLKDRGRIAPGFFADLVVFDPAGVRDLATYEHPHRFAAGIEQVIVNGTLTYHDGSFTDTRAGRVL